MQWWNNLVNSIRDFKAIRIELMQRPGDLTFEKYSQVCSEMRTCPKCQSRFFCRSNESCWCMHLKIDTETLQSLRDQYHSCLCEACLKSYIERSKDGQAARDNPESSSN